MNGVHGVSYDIFLLLLLLLLLLFCCLLLLFDDAVGALYRTVRTCSHVSQVAEGLRQKAMDERLRAMDGLDRRVRYELNRVVQSTKAYKI